MKRKELTGILTCFCLLFFAAVAWAEPLPAMGQAKCHDTFGNVTAGASSGRGLRDRGHNYCMNGSGYIKLDDRGNALRDSASKWSMVKDKTSGLIWEVKTNKDGVKNYQNPHDADNTYSWFDRNPLVNGGYEGTPGDGTDTEDFIDRLNKASFGGFSDWRLPTLKELNAIVNYDIPSPGPAINAAFFPNTQSSFYWTSTPSVGYEYRAWVVNFEDGYAHNYGKYGFYFVRAVSGGQVGSPPGTKAGLTDELLFAYLCSLF